MSDPLFDASGRDRPYDFLAECPDELLAVVLTLPESLGSLQDRVKGARAWHDALMQGNLPVGDAWPPPPFGERLHAQVQKLSIARFCKGQRDLVCLLLLDLLAALDAEATFLCSEIERLLQEFVSVQRSRSTKQRNRDRPSTSVAFNPFSGTGVPLDDDSDSAVAYAALREEAEQKALRLMSAMNQQLMHEWMERASAWTAIADVFGDLGDLLGVGGYDFAKGMLRQIGWRELVRLRALIEKLPQLRDVVRQLGRLHYEGDEDPAIADRVFTPMRRTDVTWRDRPDPLVPAEIKGVVRSGDIARMLPVEAALLGHPTLKMLWHARRAEQALLAYRVEGTDLICELVEGDGSLASQRPACKPIRGPIIAIVDTSASMWGMRGQVAKALSLEALRIAHTERRDCLLFSFGSTGELLEHRLNLDQSGLEQLLSFLTLSFGGGTDAASALRAVLDRLAGDTWANADVLFVSDGEWHVDRITIDLVARARQQGHRFHGVQVGSGSGLGVVCDPVHSFTDWRELSQLTRD